MTQDLAPNTSLSHYRIERKLGAGGMAAVYLAHDTRLQRSVALKLLPAASTADRGRLQRFEQEACAASALNHPNILTVYEIGVENDTHFIATEHVDGVTLRERLEEASMTVVEALDVAHQVTAALTAAHAAGVVDRDIKPENIMLRHDQVVKLLDFGIAKLTDPEDRQTPHLSVEGFYQAHLSERCECYIDGCGPRVMMPMSSMPRIHERSIARCHVALLLSPAPEPQTTSSTRPAAAQSN
jgi:serine/threonine protein kinase